MTGFVHITMPYSQSKFKKKRKKSSTLKGITHTAMYYTTLVLSDYREGGRKKQKCIVFRV